MGESPNITPTTEGPHKGTFVMQTPSAHPTLSDPSQQTSLLPEATQDAQPPVPGSVPSTVSITSSIVPMTTTAPTNTTAHVENSDRNNAQAVDSGQAVGASFQKTQPAKSTSIAEATPPMTNVGACAAKAAATATTTDASYLVAREANAQPGHQGLANVPTATIVPEVAAVTKLAVEPHHPAHQNVITTVVGDTTPAHNGNDALLSTTAITTAVPDNDIHNQSSDPMNVDNVGISSEHVALTNTVTTPLSGNTMPKIGMVEGNGITVPKPEQRENVSNAMGNASSSMAGELALPSNTPKPNESSKFTTTPAVTMSEVAPTGVATTTSGIIPGVGSGITATIQMMPSSGPIVSAPVIPVSTGGVTGTPGVPTVVPTIVSAATLGASGTGLPGSGGGNTAGSGGFVSGSTVAMGTSNIIGLAAAEEKLLEVAEASRLANDAFNRVKAEKIAEQSLHVNRAEEAAQYEGLGSEIVGKAMKQRERERSNRAAAAASRARVITYQQELESRLNRMEAERNAYRRQVVLLEGKMEINSHKEEGERMSAAQGEQTCFETGMNSNNNIGTNTEGLGQNENVANDGSQLYSGDMMSSIANGDDEGADLKEKIVQAQLWVKRVQKQDPQLLSQLGTTPEELELLLKSDAGNEYFHPRTISTESEPSPKRRRV